MGLVAARAMPKEERRKSRSDASKTVKKGKGLPAGSRFNPSALNKDLKSVATQIKQDPRHGSKKPIPLIFEAPLTAKQQPAYSKSKDKNAGMTPLNIDNEAWEAELAELENDEALQAFLERLETGEQLAEEDAAWVDEQLARYQELLQKLGIDLDELDDIEEEI